MRIKTRPAFLNIITVIIFVFIAIPQLAGQSNDSLILAKESQHFDFYSTIDDTEVLDSLAATLENNYYRITKHLGIQIDTKIKVKVYPDLKTFHSAIQLPDAPDWVVGSCISDELLMVSPVNPGNSHTYQSLMQVIVHEFVHIAVYLVVGEEGVKNFQDG